MSDTTTPLKPTMQSNLIDFYDNLIYSNSLYEKPESHHMLQEYFSQSSHTSHASHDSLSSAHSVDHSVTSTSDAHLPELHENVGSIDEKLSMEWKEENETVVREPYDYVAGIPGKEIRRQLLNAFNVWYQVDEQASKLIADAVTMAHNASLLIDDIQDSSKLRRGMPCAHEVYDTAQTINSANYVYFQAQELLFGLRNWPQAVSVFNDEMINLHRGQGMELFWRDNLLPPSEEDYLQMIANKTGGLFRLINRLLQAASKQTVEVGQLVDVLGLYFQILDDYKNIREEKMASQKGFFEDLTEGKFSFPICHSIWAENPNKDDLIDMMRMKTEDMAVKKQAVHILERSGSLEYTKHVLYGLDRKSRELLAESKRPNAHLEGLLDLMRNSLERCG